MRTVIDGSIKITAFRFKILKEVITPSTMSYVHLNNLAISPRAGKYIKATLAGCRCADVNKDSVKTEATAVGDYSLISKGQDFV